MKCFLHKRGRYQYFLTTPVSSRAWGGKVGTFCRGYRTLRHRKQEFIPDQ